MRYLDKEFGRKLGKDWCYVCGMKLYRRKFTDLNTGKSSYQWIHLRFIGPGNEVIVECPGARGGRRGPL